MNREKKRILPFVTEFIKFSTGFAAIVAMGLLSLHIASIAMN